MSSPDWTHLERCGLKPKDFSAPRVPEYEPMPSWLQWLALAGLILLATATLPWILMGMFLGNE